jgi:thymidine kinase
MQHGKVTCIFGSMMSGKSTMLLSYVERALYANKKPVIVRPRTDSRDYVSRKKQKPGCPILSIDDRLLELGNELDEYDTIYVDEGQFVNKIGPDSNSLALSGKHVVIASLLGDSDMKPWTNVSELLPYVDEIIKVNAVCCYCGSDERATFTFYEGMKSQQVVIGDETDHYRAACRNCWHKRTIINDARR